MLELIPLRIILFASCSLISRKFSSTETPHHRPELIISLGPLNIETFSDPRLNFLSAAVVADKFIPAPKPNQIAPAIQFHSPAIQINNVNAIGQQYQPEDDGPRDRGPPGLLGDHRPDVRRGRRPGRQQ